MSLTSVMDLETPAMLSDADLLDQFVNSRDEASFRALLDRYAPMVHGVCHRVLRNRSDAEDAFQATFLVLVKKAATIQPRSLVGNWLYGVALSTSLKARAMNAKRQTREREVPPRPGPSDLEELWQQVRPLLDVEIAALPVKYRTAIVACDLEGKSLKEAARLLDCPIGTVGTRLSRARTLLAARLTRRGVTVTAVALGVLIPQHTASAAVPPALLESTAVAANACLEAQPASWTAAEPLRTGYAVLILKLFLQMRARSLIVIIVLGLLGTTLIASLSETSAVSAATKPKRSDFERLQDEWVIASLTRGGVVASRAECDRFGSVRFVEDHFLGSDAMGKGLYRLDSDRRIRTIDLAPASAASLLRGHGIYMLDRNTLTICFGASNERPTDFASHGGEHPTTLIVLQRKNPKPCCLQK